MVGLIGLINWKKIINNTIHKYSFHKISIKIINVGVSYISIYEIYMKYYIIEYMSVYVNII